MIGTVSIWLSVNTGINHKSEIRILSQKGEHCSSVVVYSKNIS